MKESVFQSEMANSIAELLPDAHYVKIPDAPIFGNAATFRRVPVYKPYDCFILNKGVFFAIEAKMHNSFLFPLNKIKENQIQGLKQANIAGAGRTLFFINVRGKLNKKHTALNDGNDKAVRAFSIDLFTVLMAIDNGDKSINVLDDGGEIPRIKLPSGKYGWDIRGFLNTI